MKQRIFLLLFVAIAAFHPQQTQAQPGDRGQGFTPEERAEQQTVMMTEKLSLSEAQAARVKEVNLKYALKMKEARDANADGDREVMREKMQAMRLDQDAELKTYLTEEQWAQWEKVREEMRGNRGRPRTEGENKN